MSVKRKVSADAATRRVSQAHQPELNSIPTVVLASLLASRASKGSSALAPRAR
jgi:hypothetical protein